MKEETVLVPSITASIRLRKAGVFGMVNASSGIMRFKATMEEFRKYLSEEEIEASTRIG